jgi:hypothetical protein
MFRSLRLLKLPNFLTFKDLPEPLNHLAKPLVLVSVGLHAALLFAPIPSPISKTKPVEPKPKTVRITTLPPLKSKSLPQTKLSSKTLRKPLTSSSTNKQLVIPNSKKTPNKIAQDPKTQQKPTPQPDSPPAGGSPSDPNNPLSGFPHYPSAGPGCLSLESCYQTSDSLDVVVQHFAKQLPLKYPDANPANDGTHPHVFRFSKYGVIYFLSIVTENKATIYAIDDKPKTLEDLKQAIEVPSDFSSNILANLPDPTDALPENFESPLNFFVSLGGALPQGTKDDKGNEIGGMEVNAEQKSGIISMKLVPSQAPQQLFNSYFAPNLGQLGYQPAKTMTSFGGGLVYELKKGTKSRPFYLNLVPGKGGKGTIVVVWPSQPS